MRFSLAFILVLVYVLRVDARRKENMKQLEKNQKNQRQLENYQKGQNKNMGHFNYNKRSSGENDDATESPYECEPPCGYGRPPWTPPSKPILKGLLLKAVLVYPFWLLSNLLG